MGLSISQRKGHGDLRHDNREYIAKNVDPTRTSKNIVFIQEKISEAYRKSFGEAVDKYNKKQKRADRKIIDYFKETFGEPADSIAATKVLTSRSKIKSFYEDLVQVGDMHDCGCDTPNGKIAINCLKEYYLSFIKRNPKFYVFNAVIHIDEKTPHLHIDYIPVATGYKKGMEVKNGYNKALEQMGYKGENGFMKWREKERDVFRDICISHNLKVTKKSDEKNRGKNYSIKEYKNIVKEAENIAKETINNAQNQAADILLKAKNEAEKIIEEADKKIKK